MKRKQRRTIRYRPVRQERLIAIRVALIAVVAVSVSLMFTAVWRTIATHRLNAQLQALHTADGAAPSVVVAAPPISTADQADDVTAILPEGLALMGSGNTASVSVLSDHVKTAPDVIPATR